MAGGHRDRKYAAPPPHTRRLRGIKIAAYALSWKSMRTPLVLTIRKTRLAWFGMTAMAALSVSAAAAAQAYPIRPDQPPASFPESKGVEAGRAVGEIVTQPIRDVGAERTEIPEILAASTENPYRLDGALDCQQVARSIESLDAVLGPDFVVSAAEVENRKGRLAEAGGRMVVNSLIPFRGIVREISGAAMRDREMARAVDAGFARRGFLRGLEYTMTCRAQTASLAPQP